MRVLFFLGALAIVGLVITGAIKMQKSGDSISIQIDKTRVRQDADKVIEEGKEVLHEAEDALNRETSQR